MIENENVGLIIKESRERLGVSERKLAKLSGISNSSLSKIERGLILPSPKVLKRLCRYLDIYFNDVMYLMGIGNYSSYLNPKVMEYYSNLSGKEVNDAWLSVKGIIKHNEEILKSLNERKDNENFTKDKMDLLIDTIKDLEYENKTNYEIVKVLEKTILKERFEYERAKLENAY